MAVRFGIEWERRSLKIVKVKSVISQIVIKIFSLGRPVSVKAIFNAAPDCPSKTKIG
jgi:hypothetical protein